MSSKLENRGLLGFWLRFDSVAGGCNPALSWKPRQKPRILAAHCYLFSVNVLDFVPGNPGEKSRVVLSGFSADAQETRNRRAC